jgi:hypothetical protein
LSPLPKARGKILALEVGLPIANCMPSLIEGMAPEIQTFVDQDDEILIRFL